uniref:Uncharacterized protein n=1 Tax=Mustela putorius furo TaxID=9669 RepID=M3Y5V0_MUSPF
RHLEAGLLELTGLNALPREAPGSTLFPPPRGDTARRRVPEPGSRFSPDPDSGGPPALDSAASRTVRTSGSCLGHPVGGAGQPEPLRQHPTPHSEVPVCDPHTHGGTGSHTSSIRSVSSLSDKILWASPDGRTWPYPSVFVF